jgi:phosphatidylserine/phosphatidylglycerophosphate/cardiolipin synthase-like enzyme
MKKLLVVIVLSLAPLNRAQNHSPSAIEIVESIPVETTLDNPEIPNTLEVWLEMIQGASRTIDLEQFYISDQPGKLLQNVLSAIRAAADRGVRVRIIVDARMYKTYPESVDSLGKNRNIETRRIDFAAIGGGIQHAKYFIVDDQEVFVGSQNFDWRALEHIHELGLRIRSREVAAAYGDVFELDWQLAAGRPDPAHGYSIPEKRYTVPIRIPEPGNGMAALFPTFSPKGFIPDPGLWDEKAIVELIAGAEKTLTLQFLSYSPLERGGGVYPVIDDAIRSAAKRGVKVRMIVSDWEKGTPAVSALRALSAVNNVEVAFTSIPDWSGGYVPFARVEHCKYIVADTAKFWLGTSNCEKSYFHSSRNLGIVCLSARLGGELSRIFLKSWDSPYRQLITMQGEYPPREHGEKAGSGRTQPH